jgi:hypothetical protein
MRKSRIALISAIVVFALMLSFLIIEKTTYGIPIDAKDSDGTPSEEIMQNMIDGQEMVILKANPFGYIEVGGWRGPFMLKKATAIVEWKTYKDFGAGNIYVGYSFGGNYSEIGPFGESENITTTEINIPVGVFEDLSKLKIRFKGEDMDFGPEAIAEARIRLKIIGFGV